MKSVFDWKKEAGCYMSEWQHQKNRHEDVWSSNSVSGHYTKYFPAFNCCPVVSTQHWMLETLSMVLKWDTYFFFNPHSVGPFLISPYTHTNTPLRTPIRVKQFTPCIKFCSGPKSSVGNHSVGKHRCTRYPFFFSPAYWCLFTEFTFPHSLQQASIPFFSNSTVPTTGQQDTSIYKEWRSVLWEDRGICQRCCECKDWWKMWHWMGKKSVRRCLLLFKKHKKLRERGSSTEILH